MLPVSVPQQPVSRGERETAETELISADGITATKEQRGTAQPLGLPKCLLQEGEVSSDSGAQRVSATAAHPCSPSVRWGSAGEEFAPAAVRQLADITFLSSLFEI